MPPLLPGHGVRYFDTGSSAWGLKSSNDTSTIRYGANCHFGLNYTEYVTNIPNVLNAMVSMGLNCFRDNVTWEKFEGVAGVYTFNASGDTYSQKMFQAFAYIAANNLDLHMTLSAMYGSSVYANPPTDMAVWSDHFCDAFAAQAQGYIDAGYDPTKLTFELWNEANAFSYWDSNAEAAQLAQVMIDLYARIKAVNSGFEVIGPNTTDCWWYHRAPRGWPQAFWAVSGWSAATDAWPDHFYNSAAGQPLSDRLPEVMFWLNMENPPWNGGFYSDFLAPAALADGKANLPIIVNEFGYPGADTEAVIAKIMPRAYAIYSAIEKVKEVTCYEFLNSPSGSQYGLATASAGVITLKAQGNALAEALVHLKLSTKRSYYRTSTYNTGDHSVLLVTPTGERLMIWTLTSNHSVDIPIIAQSGGGTLSIQTIGGSTATQAINLGVNIVSVALTDNMKVLYADVPISFGFPP